MLSFLNQLALGELVIATAMWNLIARMSLSVMTVAISPATDAMAAEMTVTETAEVI